MPSAIESVRFEGGEPLPAIRLGATQHITVTADASTATPLSIDARVFRVFVAGGVAHIAIGPDPVATTDDPPIMHEIPEHFICRPGDKVALRLRSGTGEAWITAAGEVEP